MTALLKLRRLFVATVFLTALGSSAASDDQAPSPYLYKDTGQLIAFVQPENGAFEMKETRHGFHIV